ncbi:Abi family protein [Xanthobacter sp. V7C-4]|uniref:Abi family protein n=1 Tax=Xanthobacter autotrophicus (strain ATCC BAA-1158 / Py2) TaxID=78245 RepID=UPI00372844A2
MPQRIVTLSLQRFDTYVIAAGHNQQRAFALYVWNAQIGASFHILIQAIEVALRNRVNHALVSEFGADWWDDATFLATIDRNRVADLDAVKRRLANKGMALETNQIVASLSFGFWVGMLHSSYNPPIWSKHFRSTFTNVPKGVNRYILFTGCGKIASFRNRVSHHEPLIKHNISQEYSDMFQMLDWLCPDTSVWIRKNCTVQSVMRQKP